MKFTHVQNQLLSEVYRRLNYFHNGNLDEPLLMLDYPSSIKRLAMYGLLKPYSKEIPRALNWYNLTDKGKKFFSHYVTKEKLSEKLSLDIYIGVHVKEFDRSILEKI